jgi:hypothetical protein
MATKNQRIAAYVPENVYQKYQSFKAEKGLGDSQALIKILSEYFGVTHSEPLGDSLTLAERVERLEELIHSPLAMQPPAVTPDPIPIEPELKTDLPVVSPGQLSFLAQEEASSAPANGIPAKADGGRWLTTRQAHQAAVDRGFDRNLNAFKGWSGRSIEDCIIKFSLRRLESPSKSHSSPAFEDLRHADSVQVQ